MKFRTEDELREALAQVEAKIARHKQEVEQAQGALDFGTDDGKDHATRLDQAKRARANAEEIKADIENALSHYARIRAAAGGEYAIDRSGDYRSAPHASTESLVDRQINHYRDVGLRANERATFLPDDARAHMERTLREDDDPEQRLARYIDVASSRDYLRAFGKWLRDPVSGGHEWTPQERDAVQRVRLMERAIGLGAQGGGFLTPYELDPNIIIASAGYRDPMRRLARLATTIYNEKRFVTSVGVNSAWYNESAEVSDDSPTLLQPVVTCRKAMSFVAVTFELFEDSDIVGQLGAIFADAKANLESTAFTTGTGVAPQPKGVITAVSAVGGSVIATGTNVLAAADVYNNQSSLPARWRPNARFMANLSIINGYRQLPKATNIQESLVDDSGDVPRMAGWEVHENNAMDGVLTATAADYALISGDFRQFAIVDRVGSFIEMVPVLLGANRRPTGERGVLLHWRTGSDVLVADAFRITNYSG